MPDLDTTVHLDMLNNFKNKFGQGLYGLQWGDPETMPPLKFIKNRFIDPFVSANHTALEIGPGGGRWTRYLLGFKQVYAVDFYAELLDELRKGFNASDLVFIKNNGTDFPGINDDTVNYLFSFGTFVHLDLHLIESYLKNMKRVVKSGGNIVIQYADKTKDFSKFVADPNFSNNTPEKMRMMVQSAGYEILEEDLTTLWHSSVIRFTH